MQTEQMREHKEQSFGELFSKIRQDAGFSLIELSNKTKITQRHLEYLEAEQFDKLPPQVYVRGFIVKCAHVLGTEEKNKNLLEHLYMRHRNLSIRLEDGVKTANKGFHLTPKHMTFLAGSIFVASLFSYFLIRFIPSLFVPQITIDNLKEENLVVNFGDITTSGSAKYAASLTLNGEELYIGKNGQFERSVFLDEGVNILKFEAHNIFGRRNEVVKRVVYIKN